ncbi:MAG: alpha-hydroxy acid oxidase [Opitutaceae bacterium]
MSPTPEPQRVTRRQALTSFALAAGGAIAATSVRAQPAALSSATPPPSAPDPAPGGASTAGAAAAAPISVPQYQERAKGMASTSAWEFYDSGCADDVTVRWNREAFTRVRLESRVMVDVEKIDTRIKLLGHELPHPILLAPAASHMLVHPEGEVATARGASAASAIMVLSTNSNRTVEAVAAAATQPLWMQLYVSRDRDIAKELIQRVDAAGYKALCVTVDQPVIYTRDRVVRGGPALPLPNVRRPVAGATASSGGRTRSLTWKDLEWFRSVTKMPIILKGILHPDDAEQAIKAGADAIIVSNHGGRALDGVAATIDALPRVAQRVAGRIPILMDGGIRRGGDIVKALARGANAILIGRPYLYGLAVNGSEGVRHVVQILRNELESAMALTGKTSIAQIDRSALWPDNP